MRHALALVLLLAAAPLAAAGTVVISEVLYDWPGGDDGKVFVELHGPGGFDLSGYELVGVNGSGGSITHRVALTGSRIPPDGFFVLADETGGAVTFVANADLTDRNFDLQNGPDSVQLRLAGTIVDALGYGTFGASHVFRGEGTAASGVSAGWSLARRFADVDTGNNAADFVALSSPTPGTGPLSAVAVPTPAASTMGLLGCALVFLGAARRRRRAR